MKRYKLLKDLPNVSKGRIFTLTEMMIGDTEGEVMVYRNYSKFFGENRSVIIPKKDILNFDEWFEEVESQEYFYIDSYGNISQTSYEEYNVRPYKPKTQSETTKKNGKFI